MQGAEFWLGCAAGAAVGQLQPHEAFTLGGATSVRGYTEGALGTGSRHATPKPPLCMAGIGSCRLTITAGHEYCLLSCCMLFVYGRRCYMQADHAWAQVFHRQC